MTSFNPGPAWGNTRRKSAYRRREDRKTAFAVIVTLIVVIGIIGYFALALLAPLRHSTVTIHAYGKENGSKGQRVYTTDHDGIYTVKDSILNGHMDSGTLYAKLPVPLYGFGSGVGSEMKTVTLTCTVTGWRIPLLSEFKNIIACGGV